MSDEVSDEACICDLWWQIGVFIVQSRHNLLVGRIKVVTSSSYITLQVDISTTYKYVHTGQEQEFQYAIN
jgi:hypothetical protein